MLKHWKLLIVLACIIGTPFLSKKSCTKRTEAAAFHRSVTPC